MSEVKPKYKVTAEEDFFEKVMKYTLGIMVLVGGTAISKYTSEEVAKTSLVGSHDPGTSLQVDAKDTITAKKGNYYIAMNLHFKYALMGNVRLQRNGPFNPSKLTGSEKTVPLAEISAEELSKYIATACSITSKFLETSRSFVVWPTDHERQRAIATGFQQKHCNLN